MLMPKSSLITEYNFIFSKATQFELLAFRFETKKFEGLKKFYDINLNILWSF